MMLPLFLALALAPAEPIDTERAFSFSGERIDAGSVTAAVVPAPDCPGLYSLKLVYHLEKHAQDWLDASFQPNPPLSLPQHFPLTIRAEQPTDYLTLKLMDPDAPGDNHAAYEQALRYQGQPLPAGKWVTLDIPLPADPKVRDGIDYFDFYVWTQPPAVPLGRDLVFYVGQFAYTPPPRPPWPPKAEVGTGAAPLPLPPLGNAAPWVPAGGTDIQTKNRVAFVEGGAEFDADANGWNEFLHTDPAKLVLEPKTTYRLQFDYTILREAAGPDESYFYFLVRTTAAPIREDVGWQRWKGSAGESGRRVFTFTTKDYPGYYLIWGVRNQGALRLEHLALTRVGQEGK